MTDATKPDLLTGVRKYKAAYFSCEDGGPDVYLCEDVAHAIEAAREAGRREAFAEAADELQAVLESSDKHPDASRDAWERKTIMDYVGVLRAKARGSDGK